MNTAMLILLGYLFISILCTLVLVSACIVGSGHDRFQERTVHATNRGNPSVLQRQPAVFKWQQNVKRMRHTPPF